MRRLRKMLCVAALGTVGILAPTFRATAHEGHVSLPPAQRCGALTIACAATISPSVAPDGTLWIVGRVGDRLFVAHADGKAFSAPVAVDVGKVTLDWGPDARPQLAVAPDGTIALAYSTFREKFDGEIFLTRSTDGGRSFATPTPITDVQESQRFPVVAFDRSGTLHTAWVDKRGRIAARAAGTTYTGAALAVASGDSSHTGAADIVEKQTCECCRIAQALMPDGRPVILFRNIFPGHVRDHAVLVLDAQGRPGPLRRVSVDDWATEVCPHQGPSLAVAPDGSLHAVWFTLGTARHGLFYAHSRDEGASWSPPMPVGIAGQAMSRPYVLAIGHDAWLAWKAFDGKTTRIMAMASHDGGSTWGAARQVDATDGPSDHPILIDRAGQAVLSWQTDAGYRLDPLGGAS